MSIKLDDPVTTIPFIGESYAQKLAKLNIFTINNLLNHLPSRFLDYSQISDIPFLKIDNEVTVEGVLTAMANQYTRNGRKIQIGQLSGTNGTLALIWFNQPFLVRALPLGTKLSVAGKVSWWARQKAIINPSFEKIIGDERKIHTGKFVAIYPETAGISSKWLRSRID